MSVEQVSRARKLRHWLYANLEPSARTRPGLSPLNKVLAGAICLASAFAVLESEPDVRDGNDWIFAAAEIVFSAIFLAEYLARAWVTADNPRYGHGWRGRLRYLVSFTAVIDLIALTPILLPFVGGEAFMLRLFRLIRILRLARLGRYSNAMRAIGEAVHSRRYELVMSGMIAGMLLLVSSTLLNLFEGPAQPDTFGSIPRAMWWSICTLTTVGYGDVYPITPVGKILAGVTALTGIGLIAMPTGILAAAFSDAIRRQHPNEILSVNVTEVHQDMEIVEIHQASVGHPPAKRRPRKQKSRDEPGF